MEVGQEEQHIGHYRLGRTIGKGGFARVREAWHQPTGVTVAVKIINKEKMQNSCMISKVKRQVKILKFLRHPHIIKLYEVLHTNKDIFVVMEMARGGELYEYIQRHGCTEQEAKLFFSQIMEGVQFAHLNLVAHRDLKPQNVLLDGHKMVKIADFGLSNLMRDGNLLKTHCGSLNYVAPEIISNKNYEGTAVDVWSCGVILYTMLTGTLPFEEEAIAILNKKIQKAEFIIPDNVPPLAKDLIYRMLRANPLQRLRVPQIRKHPWLRKTLPIYANVSFFSSALRDVEEEIDMETLQQVRGFGMESLRNFEDRQRIGKIIKLKTDDSFVIAYQLLKDQQQKHLNQGQKNKDTIEDSFHIILPPVNNKLHEKSQERRLQIDGDFKFGREFGHSSRIVMGVILDVLDQLSINFQVKDTDYKLACTYHPPRRRYRRRSSYHTQNKIFGFQDQQRFVKTQLKFNLQLYITDNNAGRVLVDLKLTQGHPLVFLPFAKDFLDEIEEGLQK